MHRKSARHFVLFICLTSALLAEIGRADSSTAARPLREQLSPEEFAALGLDKLTPEELARLAAWIEHRGSTIREHTRVATRTETLHEADQQAQDQGARVFATPTDRFITSRIAGPFHGLHGRGSLIGLENGQTWRLVEDRRVSAELAAPKVTLRRSLAGNHYLWIEGVPGMFAVVRDK
jgi:hypothetical protein